MNETLANPTDATLAHLRAAPGAFAVPRRPGAPLWADRELHQALYAQDPQLYALSALAPGVTPGCQEQVLLCLLLSPRAGLPAPAARLLQRVSGVLAAALPDDRVLRAFLALRRLRRCPKPAARLIVEWVVNHPHLEALARARRPAVLDALEHALGRDVARGCLRRIAAGEAEDPYVRRNLLRRARDPQRFARLAPFLLRQAPHPDPDAPARAAPAAAPDEPPGTVNATNRGRIAAALVHLYRGGETPALRRELQDALDEAAAALPRFAGRLGVVLDASASTEGYGDRQHCVISQSAALTMLLQRACPDLALRCVGGGRPRSGETSGQGELWAASGATDLAEALLDVAEQRPDVIAVLTDGYENVEPGDLAAVAAALPGAGVAAPVLICTSQFTGRDDLAHRQPAPALRALPFWHQRDFPELLAELFSAAPGELGRSQRQRALEARLQAAETEVRPWITP